MTGGSASGSTGGKGAGGTIYVAADTIGAPSFSGACGMIRNDNSSSTGVSVGSNLDMGRVFLLYRNSFDCNATGTSLIEKVSALVFSLFYLK